MSAAAALDTLLPWLMQLLWPLLRIGAALMAAPIFGARNVPVNVRVLFSFALAAMVAPLLDDLPVIDPLTAVGALVALQQVLIGLLMGFMLQMVFSAVAAAGESMAFSMGLGFALANDPQNGVQVPVVSQYFVIIATILFLSLNGHLVLFQILVDSFRFLPIGVDAIGFEVFYGIALWGANMFRYALLIAMPVIVAMLLINLALGVVARAAPQLNIFAVGFPVMLTAGLVMILVSLPTLVTQLELLLQAAFSFMIRF